ncbi:MAG: alcohol dehydrogenase catalytic domain-containing protein [Butyricimonas faecihominis]
MLAYTYISKGNFKLQEKPLPQIEDSRDAIVRVTLGSIFQRFTYQTRKCPRAVPGITVGHEMVGIVEQTGADVTTVKPETE